MRKLTLVSAVLIILFVLSNITQAGNNPTVSYSPTNITQAMDVAVRSNSMSYLYTLTSSQIDSASKGYVRPDTLRLKNPNTAMVIAILPGSIVHGAGHFYARRPVTGAALLGIEMVSLVFFVRAIGQGLSDTGSPEQERQDSFIGTTLFFGSWLYDIIVAPLTIAKENEKISEKRAAK
ncbi:MAG: hypothetical protein MUP17_01100 [candidate division Zixibacteria bacterium]|nr:hypothetical protein [candidate division Zixibacteria bacterium]